MQALILAGGKGTRLRPLTVYTPKPVVPVFNRPFLLYQIDILRKAGIKEVTLSLSYQPDKIEHVIGNGSEYGVNIRYITEPTPMGTAGAYKLAADLIRDTIIVLNGDILTNIDIAGLIDFHRGKNSAATIALFPVDDISRYGVCEADDAGRVTRFLEKPQGEDRKTLTANTINAGIYVLEPAILDLIEKDKSRSFEYDVFPEILRRALPFYGCIIANRYWRDIGTPENYLQAHHDLLANRIEGFQINAAQTLDIATRTRIDAASVLGEGCVIKPGSQIVKSVIGPGVHVEEKAFIENSVIWSHTRVAAGAHIKGSIIGRSCHIGRNAIVDGSVLGDKTTLTDYTKV